eukprot:scaffold1084_cov315-Pavlova_lutheri.AAC.1
MLPNSTKKWTKPYSGIANGNVPFFPPSCPLSLPFVGGPGKEGGTKPDPIPIPEEERRDQETTGSDRAPPRLDMSTSVSPRTGGHGTSSAFPHPKGEGTGPRTEAMDHTQKKRETMRDPPKREKGRKKRLTPTETPTK